MEQAAERAVIAVASVMALASKLDGAKDAPEEALLHEHASEIQTVANALDMFNTEENLQAFSTALKDLHAVLLQSIASVHADSGEEYHAREAAYLVSLLEQGDMDTFLADCYAVLGPAEFLAFNRAADLKLQALTSSS